MIELVRQYDSMDCGPACLTMVVRYYGKYYTLDSIREICFQSRDGTSISDLANASKEIGFYSNPGLIKIEQLIKDTSLLPCILYWEQRHFVVLYAIKKKKNKYIFSIADPEKGLIDYNETEFKVKWISISQQNKGYILGLKPNSTYYEKKGEKKPSRIRNAKFIINLFSNNKRYFNHIIIGLIIGSLLQLILPFLTQVIVDIGINYKDISFIKIILLGQLILLISRTGVTFIRSHLLLYISMNVNVTLISTFFIKLMKLPMRFFDTKLFGDLIQRIEDHDRVKSFVTEQSLDILFSLLTIIIFCLVLLFYNLSIFTIFIFGAIIYTLWTFSFLKKRKSLDYKYFSIKTLNKDAVYQLINGMQEIKLQGCENEKREKWESIQTDLYKIYQEKLLLQQKHLAGCIFINEFRNILITMISAYYVINGNLTLGIMLSIQYIIGQLTAPIDSIVSFINDWQDVNISIDRINEIHNKKDENVGRYIDKTPNEDISIKNLTFQYGGASSQKVLNNINITIPKGKITAVVGSSGSGKTTLIKLLLGSYSPTKGTINIGNASLTNIDLRWWRKQCGTVTQEGFIFSDTIEQNIAMSTSVDQTKLIHATKLANIHQHILSLPAQYYTNIGVNGVGLSQGQKQRILIARAIYRDPSFIFLDEATNSLDANNEKTIINNLATFYKGKTVIIVAHRLSTVSNADQILVLDKGTIIESGTHNHLISKKGYYNLIKNQLELSLN